MPGRSDRAGRSHLTGAGRPVANAARLSVLIAAAAGLATLSAARAEEAAGEVEAAARPAAALVEAGRRIHDDGILPNGEPLVATRPEGLVLEGRYAACVTCHRASGMGSIEGVARDAILVPPLAGPVLFAPARFATTYLNDYHHYVPNDTWRRAMTRPAYDEASLAVSLREGLNSAGQEMAAPMPLYDMDESAVSALAAYLRTLGSTPDPGVEVDAVHLATVITPDADPGSAAAVLGVVRAWTNSARAAGKPWRLHEWRLTGPAGEWQAQLDELYEARPVFALLSGVGLAEWRPVHAFCEQHHIPCLMPSVDVAPVEEKGRYSLYLSPGVGLEARILAEHLASDDSLPVRVVQVFSDAAGEHAAGVLAGVMATRSVTVRTREFSEVSAEALLDELGPDDLLVLWLRPAEVRQLVAAAPQGPPAEGVMLSALLANPEDLDLPPTWRQRVAFVSLFDDLSLQGEIARLRLEHWLERSGLPTDLNRRLQADAYAASYLLNDAVSDIRGQENRRPPVPLTREHVLEVLEDEVQKLSDGTQLIDEDSHVFYYGRMSLGPGQRAAVRGGSILRYASPDSSRLVAASRRIVP
jgi:mono/diheme cytochrome c family protein